MCVSDVGIKVEKWGLNDLPQLYLAKAQLHNHRHDYPELAPIFIAQFDSHA